LARSRAEPLARIRISNPARAEASFDSGIEQSASSPLRLLAVESIALNRLRVGSAPFSFTAEATLRPRAASAIKQLVIAVAQNDVGLVAGDGVIDALLMIACGGQVSAPPT